MDQAFTKVAQELGMFQGNIDQFDSTIAGWAYDDTRPGVALDIIVEIEGVEVFRAPADLYRADLIEVIGEANHGFSFDLELPEQMSDRVFLSIVAIGSERFELCSRLWQTQNIVYESGNGWLFLCKDSNNVNLRVAGLKDCENIKTNETAALLLTRNSTLKHMGIPFCSIIVPEKNVACECLGSGVKISPHRPATLILTRAQDFDIPVDYPIDILRHRPEHYFSKTDTHLNGYGYNVLFETCARALPSIFTGKRPPNPNFVEDFSGDLGSKFEPIRKETFYEHKIPENEYHYTISDPIPDALSSNKTLRGSVVKIYNSSAKKGKLILFGTSSAYHFLPVISTVYQDTLFIWENTFDYNLIKLHNPNCVIWLVAERFLPISCNDTIGLPEILN